MLMFSDMIAMLIEAAGGKGVAKPLIAPVACLAGVVVKCGILSYLECTLLKT